MKTLILPLFILLALTSCGDYYEEATYDQREKFLGHYDVEEYSNTYYEHVYYTMQVTRGSYAREIFLHDLYAEGISVYARIDGNNLSIPYQVVDGYEIDGYGSLYRGKLTLKYTVYDRYASARTDYCETVAYRL